MPAHVVIDGNNLLHAMYEHAPLPHVGRETLVRIVERWAARREDRVTLVFDGPVPREGLADQMSSKHMAVRFSAPITADDVIVAMVQRAAHPADMRVVTSDKAIRLEAVSRRCRHTDAASFVCELFPATDTPVDECDPVIESDERSDPALNEDWLDTFGIEKEEPFDGYGAMQH